MEEAQEKTIAEVLVRLNDYEGQDVYERLSRLLDLRLNNEYGIAAGISEGVKGEHITVEDAAKLLNRSKDSISDLVKIRELLGNRPTERVELTQAEAEELKAIREGLN